MPPNDLSFDSFTNLRDTKMVGAMSFTFRGEWNGKKCVIKLARDDVRGAMDQLEQERQMLNTIGNHPHIVEFYGSGHSNNGFLFLCLEDLELGTLAKYCGTHVIGGPTLVVRWYTRNFCMTFNEMLKRALQVATAVQYLHAQGVMHRDIKSENMAFTDDSCLKLFDFGLARNVPGASLNESYTMTGGTGSLRYMAPEVCLEEPYSYSADVYSLGVVLWEMLTMKRPYDYYRAEDHHRYVVIEGKREPLDPAWPLSLRRLVSRMWDGIPQKRPPMAEVVATLKSIIAETAVSG